MAVRGLHMGLLLALVVVLGGASLVAAFRLQTRASQVADTVNPVGTVMFEPLPEDSSERRVGKLVLVTARQGSHNDAFGALMDALGQYCLDGRGYSLWDMEPGGQVDPDEWGRPSQPAGTRFSQSFSCDAPLPNELSIPVGTLEAEASALVSRSLGGKGEATVAPVSFNKQVPKYRAFDLALGTRIRSFSARRCAGGATVVHRVVVGSFPPSTAVKAGPALNETMMLGTDFDCLEPNVGQD